MLKATFNCLNKQLFQPKQNAVRPFMQWLNIIFNQIDHERRKTVGPDRVCSEWLLRNGAFVKWVGFEEYVTNYNTMPPDNAKIRVQKIEATSSSISHYGFLHLKDCNYIKEIKISDSSYIENEALKQLAFVKNSLEILHLSYLPNVSDQGILYLRELSNLKLLELFHLQFVKNKENVLNELKNSLPNCEIKSDFEKQKQVISG